MGRHLRFLAAWKLWHPILSRTNDAWRQAYSTHSWYEKQGLGRIDFVNYPPTFALTALNDYANLSVKWLASMKAYAAKSDMIWNLWNTDPLIEGEAQFNRPSDPISVKTQLSDRALLEGWSNLISPLEGADAPPGADRVFYRLNTETVSGEYEGLGRFVASLHEFSSVRTARGQH
jgi:hypothetical protein